MTSDSDQDKMDELWNAGYRPSSFEEYSEKTGGVVTLTSQQAFGFFLEAGGLSIGLDYEDFRFLWKTPHEIDQAFAMAAGLPIERIKWFLENTVDQHGTGYRRLRCAAKTRSGTRCKGLGGPCGLRQLVDAIPSASYCFIHTNRTMNIEAA